MSICPPRGALESILLNVIVSRIHWIARSNDLGATLDTNIIGHQDLALTVCHFLSPYCRYCLHSVPDKGLKTWPLSLFVMTDVAQYGISCKPH